MQVLEEQLAKLSEQVKTLVRRVYAKSCERGEKSGVSALISKISVAR